MPNTPLKTGEAVDMAARYFVYELYDATGGHAGAWKVLRDNGQVQATVARAVSADGLSYGTTRRERLRCGARHLLARGGAWPAGASGNPWIDAKAGKFAHRIDLCLWLASPRDSPASRNAPVSQF
jgi:hypothetical protein